MTEIAPSGGDFAAGHDWAGRIRAAYRSGVEAIIETGRLLAAAKEALPHGGFALMIERDLPFGIRMAEKLMAIAADQRIANATHGSHFPPSWTTLYELTRLPDDAFERGIADGAIRPDMERNEALQLVKGNRAIAHNRVEPHDSLDYFPTPPWATRALVEDVLVRRLGTGLAGCLAEDPACGEGHITGVLAEYGCRVAGYDVFDYSAAGRSAPAWMRVRDYLLAETGADDPRPDWIITNPPFGDKALPFVRKAIETARAGVAVLVRSQWAVEGIERYETLFRDRPPTLMAFFVERVPIAKGRWDPDGDTLTAYAWLVWKAGAKPRAPFMIPPGRRAQRSKSDDIERFTAHPVLPPAAAREERKDQAPKRQKHYDVHKRRRLVARIIFEGARKGRPIDEVATKAGLSVRTVRKRIEWQRGLAAANTGGVQP